MTCSFCEVSTDLTSGERSQPVGELVGVRERFSKELGAFEEAYRASVSQGQAPVVAFRGAAQSTLSGLCDPDAITNVVFGIAADFDREKGTRLTTDPNAIPRLATAYIDSLEQLTAKPTHVIHLPFLTATRSGPLNFEREVSKARLAELAATPAAASSASPAPRQGSWWKKLFG